MFKFIENLKIREIAYRYRETRNDSPGLDEDQICRLVMIARIREYPHICEHELKDRSEAGVRAFIGALFNHDLSLKEICQWFMEIEHPKYNALLNSKNLSRWRVRAKELEVRIDRILMSIPGLYE